MNINFLLLSLIFYAFTLSFTKSFNYLHLLPILLLIFFNFKKLNMKNLLINLIKLNLFIIMISLSVILFHKDYKTVILLFYRVNLILIFNLIILSSFTNEEIFINLIHLKIPWKIKSILIFSFKYIDILLKEKEKLDDALKMRHFKGKTNLFSYKIIAFILGALINRTINKANLLQDALTMRYFNGKFSTLTLCKSSYKDYIIMLATFSIFVYGLLPR